MTRKAHLLGLRYWEFVVVLAEAQLRRLAVRLQGPVTVLVVLLVVVAGSDLVDFAARGDRCSLDEGSARPPSHPVDSFSR